MSVLRTLRDAAASTCRGLIVLAVVLVALLVASTGVWAGPLDLDEAERQRDDAAARQEELQGELNKLLTRIEELRVAREQQSAQIKHLDGRLRTQRRTARRAAAEVSDRHRQAYMSGAGGDPLVAMLGGDSVDEIAERATLLSVLAADSRAEQEAAVGASRTTAASSGELEAATAQLEERTRELESTQDEAREKVAEAQAAVEELDEKIADERARRAAAARRREREQAAADNSGGESASAPSTSNGGGGSAPVSGGIACPVGQPRNYTDTYGAPRSGGRSHLGVDILAPHGTPIYAYEDGTITRMDGNALGGISLYLQGASGNLYYYTHLSGYRAGISVGQGVSAGTHIAYNGDTGNAAGIPHLHWEVKPGGGYNVNPYPYAYRACG
jgi:murein DD-endopeptidase MepM/ murein hydrolase activator NlpD